MAAAIPASGDGTGTILWITLRDGSQVPEPAFTVTMLALEQIQGKSIFAVRDLVRICKDPDYEIVTTFSKKILTKIGLIDKEGNIHPRCIPIILNAVEGDGQSLTFVDPVKQE